jgi:predicted RNA polymerase sigma factor
MTGPSLDAASERLLRELVPQVLGAVIRRFHDFAAAEDAVQEALVAAFTQWPQEGVPENPRAWLIRVASRRMLDYWRSEEARHNRETAVALEAQTLAPAADHELAMNQDDTLILFFM